MKVLVLGGTGLVGHAVVEELCQRDSIEQVNVISRRKENPFDPKSFPKVNHYQVSFNDLEHFVEKDQAFSCDALLCCLGTTIKKAKTKQAFKEVDYEYPLVAAKILKSVSPHAHFLIITAMGSDSKSVFLYNKVKGEVEQALEELKLDLLTILRPSLIIGERQESRFWEDVGQKVARTLDPLMAAFFPDAAGVSFKKIAKCMVDEALANDGIKRGKDASTKVIRSSQIKKAIV